MMHQCLQMFAVSCLAGKGSAQREGTLEMSFAIGRANLLRSRLPSVFVFTSAFFVLNVSTFWF